MCQLPVPLVGVRPFHLTISCGGQPYTRLVWARDHDDARGLVTSWPSSFGLPHERVDVLHSLEIAMIEEPALA